ncbi:hypothetical protein BJ878DRAFT_321168 [Calycina marina]|uniref:DNA mismatch repair protein S5 domain-containing protein n=1 Tax=Calycina marina TaxID=1763456 RepID=A0A9P8CHZ9_9HELO|nr:hypothetical protein BJ878DRAFT_321168 [Calycina marina]
MAITALPESTVHLLNSAQVLTTPTSLIKELVDNALDAKATSVDVAVSQNTLDRLEVKDNGHGISQDLMNVLGKRAHTSKLRSFEELKFLGGVTLGFRGEALASAIQLGNVTVTSRTDGEPIATLAKLKAGGGVKEKIRTSHPVGTTICVTNFMTKLPVRKKTFEKESSKTLAKIRQLLMSFALARPTIRFSFKVLKSQKDSWSFSPRSNDGIKEAVSQIIGRDAASQCIDKSFTFSDARSKLTTVSIDEDTISKGASEEQPNTEQFTLEIFLPYPGFDSSKIGKGQYVSIDSRPVSHDKGTMKKIVTLYKTYIRGVCSDTPDKLTNPFIRMNLVCPRASYDPNVEPAKDDVLFGNESVIINSVRQFLKNVYGEPESMIKPPRSARTTIADNPGLLRSRRHISPPPSSDDPSPAQDFRLPSAAPSRDAPEPSETAVGSSEGSPGCVALVMEPDYSSKSKGRKRSFDMSNDLIEEVGGYERRTSYGNKCSGARKETDDDNGAFIDKSVATINPMAIEKKTAPCHRKHLPKPDTESLLKTPLPHGLPRGQTTSDQTQQVTRAAPVQGSILDVLQHGLSVEPSHHPKRQLDVRTALHRPAEEDDETLLVEEPGTSRSTARRGFVTARDVSLNPSMASPPTFNYKATRRPKGTASGVHNTFVSPLIRIGDQDVLGHIKQENLPQTYQRRTLDGPAQDTSTIPVSNSELRWAIDYEREKNETMGNCCEEVRKVRAAETQVEDSQLTTVRPSPHKNRYQAAISTLDSDALTAGTGPAVPMKKVFKTSLPDDDPRAYLIRRKKYMALQSSKPGDPPKVLRAKSTRLPLENVASNPKLHLLQQTSTTTTGAVRKLAMALSRVDDHLSHGGDSSGLVIRVEEKGPIIARTRAAVDAWMQTRTDGWEKQDIEYDFQQIKNLRKVRFAK